jgi:hypothetical protein
VVEISVFPCKVPAHIRFGRLLTSSWRKSCQETFCTETISYSAGSKRDHLLWRMAGVYCQWAWQTGGASIAGGCTTVQVALERGSTAGEYRETVSKLCTSFKSSMLIETASNLGSLLTGRCYWIIVEKIMLFCISFDEQMFETPRFDRVCAVRIALPLDLLGRDQKGRQILRGPCEFDLKRPEPL